MRVMIGLLLLGWILTSPALSAATPLTLATEVPVHTLNQGELSLLLDPSQGLTLQDVRAALSKGQFQTLRGNLGLGYRPDAAWLHFQIEQRADQAVSRWLEIPVSYLDDIRLYHIDPLGDIHQHLAGDRLPFSAREVDYRATLIKLQFSPGTHQLFLRIQTSSTLAAIVKLWQPQAFEQYQRSSYFLYGFYFSLFFVVMLFNIANWVVSRRPIFLLYALYVGLIDLQWLGINGFVAEFLLPEAPLLSNLSLGVSISLVNAMAYLFFAQVLELKQYHPIMYRINLFGFVVSLLSAIATPLGYYQTLAPIMLLVGIVALMGVPWPTMRLWRMGEVWSRLLGLAYLAFGVLISINLMGVMAMIPFGEGVHYAGMASNVFHILMLHFGILLHYRRIEQEHIRLQEKILLAEQQTELERKHREEQSKMLSIITHEIRTPISIIESANETLRMMDEEAMGLSDDRHRRHERIHNAVMRANIVLELALAQLEQEDLPFKPMLADLEWLTYEVIQLIGETEQGRIHLDPPNQELVAKLDLRLIRIALLNLLGNALKYSPPDRQVGIRIESATGADGVAGCAWVIEDQGPGIPDSLRGELFRKLSGEDWKREGSGLGLGCYLVAMVAERHHGTVSVENLPAGGARFVLWIPLLPRVEENPQAAPS